MTIGRSGPTGRGAGGASTSTQVSSRVVPYGHGAEAHHHWRCPPVASPPVNSRDFLISMSFPVHTGIGFDSIKRCVGIKPPPVGASGKPHQRLLPVGHGIIRLLVAEHPLI